MARTRKAVAATRTSARRNTGISRVFRGYQGRAIQLLDLPATRYILGGVALAALAPVVMRFFRQDEVQTFVRDNVEGIRSRIDGMIHSGEERLDTLNQ